MDECKHDPVTKQKISTTYEQCPMCLRAEVKRLKGELEKPHGDNSVGTWRRTAEKLQHELTEARKRADEAEAHLDEAGEHLGIPAGASKAGGCRAIAHQAESVIENLVTAQRERDERYESQKDLASRLQAAEQFKTALSLALRECREAIKRMCSAGTGYDDKGLGAEHGLTAIANKILSRTKDPAAMLEAHNRKTWEKAASFLFSLHKYDQAAKALKAAALRESRKDAQ